MANNKQRSLKIEINITKYTKIYSGQEPIMQEGNIFKVKIPLNKNSKAQDKIIELILDFCKNEKNIFEIMDFLGYKNRTRFRRDYIKPLVEKGMLKMTIPDKPTSKNQKYKV